jgi:hypothetical protein
MPVVSYRVGFLPDLLASFATLRSLLEVGGSTSNYAETHAFGCGRSSTRQHLICFIVCLLGFAHIICK